MHEYGMFGLHEHDETEAWQPDSYRQSLDAWRGDAHVRSRSSVDVNSRVVSSMLRRLAESAVQQMQQRVLLRRMQDELTRRDGVEKLVLSELDSLRHELAELRVLATGSRAVAVLTDEHPASVPVCVGSPTTTFAASSKALLEAYQDHRDELSEGTASRLEVTSDTFALAQVALALAPSNVPSPEFSVGPSGEILFDWWKAAKKSLTMSVTPSGKLLFAAIDGTSLLHGSEELVHGFPRAISDALSRLFEETQSE